jgi:predicted PurR-regulated permease PerM
MIDNNESIDRDRFTTTSIEIAIRLSVLAILLYLAFTFISPFLTIVIWSAVLSVTLYPTFNFVASRLGDRRRLAAIVTTCFSLLLVVGPATWLALGLFEGIRSLYERFDISLISLPAPPATIKDWPLIGDHIFQLWTLASTNIQAALGHLAPYLKPLGSGLLRIAADAGTGVLQFLIAIIVAGFLYTPAPSIVHGIKMFSKKLAGSQADEFVNLAGVTIRAVSRGVIGISALQALLASLGFMAVGVPGTPLITSAVLIFGILQIGPSIVVIPVIIWTWLHVDTMAALFFTIYIVPVNLLDNILKPLVMARGLSTPMLVILIGLIGGTLGYGITGLFLGPIVLAVIWELFAAWIKEGDPN